MKMLMKLLLQWKHHKAPGKSPFNAFLLRMIPFLGLFLTFPYFDAKAAELPALTSVSGSPRLAGKFVWADLATDNVLAAQSFYTGLFGWKFYDFGGYIVGFNDDWPLCGMFQKPRPQDPSARPRWFGYLSVPNVGKAEKVVSQAGGKVLAPPKQFPKRGEQAVFADPEGAIFGVIKSSSGDPEDFKPDPGNWVWIQLMSRDSRAAAEFYRKVGGYQVIENTSGGKLSDYVLASKGFARATVRTIPREYANVRPTWLPFVRVSNINASVSKAKELGGKVMLEPKAEWLDGKVAVVADPTGASIGLMEWGGDQLKGIK